MGFPKEGQRHRIVRAGTEAERPCFRQSIGRDGKRGGFLDPPNAFGDFHLPPVERAKRRVFAHSHGLAEIAVSELI